MPSKNLVLRTVYIDPEVDDELRNEAFAGRTSKNDLFRKYLRLGMQAARTTAEANSLPRDKPKVSAQTPTKTTMAARAKPTGKAATKVVTKRGSASSTRTGAKKATSRPGTAHQAAA
jgi:hypothetical protein